MHNQDSFKTKVDINLGFYC